MSGKSIFISVAICLTLSCSAALPNDTSNGVEWENLLMEKLTKKLPKYVQPDDLRNNSVHIFLDLYQISDVDERQGVLTAKLWVYYYYYSESARWNSADYGGKDLLLLPLNTFWSADIVALDALEMKYESFDRQMVYGHTGLVAFWSSLATVKFSCSFDVSHFPFDTQLCPIRFGPWINDQTVYRISWDPDIPAEVADLAYYSEHDEWELVRPVRISIADRSFRDVWVFDVVVLHLELKRRHLFYSVILILPNILIYCLSSLVFLLPVDSGEKISFSITILLASVVSFGTISEILPASSLNFPDIAYFLGVTVTQMAFDTLLATIVINIHFIGGRCKMGYTIRRIMSSKYLWVFGLRPCAMERAFPGKVHSENRELASQVRSQQKKSADSPNLWAEVVKKRNKVQDSTGESPEKLNVNKLMHVAEDLIQLDCEENMDFLWKYFALFVDRLFLYMHLVASIVIMIYFWKNRI